MATAAVPAGGTAVDEARPATLSRRRTQAPWQRQFLAAIDFPASAQAEAAPLEQIVTAYDGQLMLGYGGRQLPGHAWEPGLLIG
jgi:hypothetical protein